MYEATEEDRRSLQSEYLKRVEERIHHHREVIGKLRSLRRELTLRRQSVMPGWVGMEMMEEFDERSKGSKSPSRRVKAGWSKTSTGSTRLAVASRATRAFPLRGYPAPVPSSTARSCPR